MPQVRTLVFSETIGTIRIKANPPSTRPPAIAVGRRKPCKVHFASASKYKFNNDGVEQDGPGGPGLGANESQEGGQTEAGNNDAKNIDAHRQSGGETQIEQK
jgi:hypothetical protein